MADPIPSGRNALNNPAMAPLPSLQPAFALLKSRAATFSLLLFFLVLQTRAQSVVWSDSFEQGSAPSAEQCMKWNLFLDELAGKSFRSVTISGTYDEEGQTLSDPVAATQLAQLLSSRTPGTVESEGHRWTVSKCQLSACATSADDFAIALSYNGNPTECDCSDAYAIRPQVATDDWGGVNSGFSCNAFSQSLKLQFNSGASISVNGSAILCEGSSVTLMANAEGCSDPLTYEWSNGATTQSITVSTPGRYWVSITGADGCNAISESIEITMSDATVDAGEDMMYCDVPVQLNAVGKSAGTTGSKTNLFCIYDAPGGSGCNFLSDVCLEGAAFIGNSNYTTSVSLTNPVELRFRAYYSAFSPAVFKFRLNGNELGSFQETQPSGACDTRNEGKFPREFVFSASSFKSFWIDGALNQLRIEIETQFGGIYLAGLTAEVTTSDEIFAWSPATGLSDSTVSNPFASPDVTTVYKVTYTDARGCTATDEVTVIRDCAQEMPIAVCKEVVVSLEQGCEANVAAEAFDAGSTSPKAIPLTYSVSPAGPYPVGVTRVTLSVSDSTGAISTCETSITVRDTLPPVFGPLADVRIEPNLGDCNASVTLTPPVVSENCSLDSLVHDQSDNVFPAGETLVTWTATDIYGNKSTKIQRVTVINSHPVISSVMTSPSSSQPGQTVVLTGTYTDTNATSVKIEWGDGSAPTTIAPSQGSFKTSHVYGRAGMYRISVLITDQCGATDQAYEDVSVSDGKGYVRGDGWFNSERGYCKGDPRSVGKAQFHVHARHTKWSSQPSGSINFKFKQGHVDFRSTRIETLVVEDDRAIVTGVGKVNGKRDYTILISVVDEDVHFGHWGKFGKGKKENDKLRVMIRDPKGKVVYDTQIGDPENAVAVNRIDGGSIEVKSSTFADIGNDWPAGWGEEGVSVYPNPFTDWLNVVYHSESRERVVIRLLDLSGRVVAERSGPVSDDGYYTLDIPDHLGKGIYVLTITQGKRVDYFRLVRK